jgi:hypothetical protein
MDIEAAPWSSNAHHARRLTAMKDAYTAATLARRWLDAD